MSEKTLKLCVGIKPGTDPVSELPIAVTGSPAEEIYTKKLAQTKLYTWFGQVLAISIEGINGTRIAAPFSKQEDKEVIPELVKGIALVDVGTLMLQIQRECWEDTIRNQTVRCTSCGTKHDATIDLMRIEIPVFDKFVEYQDVRLKDTHVINHEGEILSTYNGQKFNTLRFRVPTLGDAIKHQGVAKDEVQFWRNIAFDCLQSLEFIDDQDERNNETVAGEYITRRGTALFKNDFSSKELKHIRTGLQTGVPSAKYYYEETCPTCRELTPFFASVSSFFLT